MLKNLQKLPGETSILCETLSFNGESGGCTEIGNLRNAQKFQAFPRSRCVDQFISSERIYSLNTLPETNIAHENPIFPGKYYQNCGFSMAMLVSGSVMFKYVCFCLLAE